MMRALLAAGLLLAAFAMPVRAAASISVNEPGPYHVGDVITLAVDPGKLKGYEYPVVIIDCPDGLYFRRWDTKGYDYPNSTGPEPVTLPPYLVGVCHVQLWAYAGFHPGVNEHIIATAPDITVEP